MYFLAMEDDLGGKNWREIQRIRARAFSSIPRNTGPSFCTPDLLLRLTSCKESSQKSKSEKRETKITELLPAQYHGSKRLPGKEIPRKRQTLKVLAQWISVLECSDSLAMLLFFLWMGGC